MFVMIKSILIFLPAPLFLILLVFPEETVTVFPPSPEKPAMISSYADTFYTLNGSQGRLVATSDTAVVFEFEARPDHGSLAVQPVSGVQFRFEKDTLDIARYEHLYFSLRMTNASSCNVSIVTGELLTDLSSKPTLIYSNAVAMLKPHTEIYRLPLNAFKAPEWWKARITRTRYLSLPKKDPDFSKVVAIRFGTDYGHKRSSTGERLEIRRIEFRKDRQALLRFAFGGCFVWLLMMAMVRFSRFRRGTRSSAVTRAV